MFISNAKIKNTLFFDIETTTRYPNYEEYLRQEPDMAKFFAEKADIDILMKFNEILYQRFGFMINDEPRLGSLGGYHILGFDIGFVFKRMLYNGIMPHPSLNTVNQKSWNIKHIIDLKDWTKPADYNGLTSFGMECVMLGIPNPKENEIDGNQVCFRFWDDHNIQAINEYCMRDTIASIQMAIALSGDGMKKRHKKTMSEWVEETLGE